VVGSGGREHALVWKLAQSQRAEKLFAAPGNPGIGALAECIPIEPGNFKALADFVVQSRIDLTVVGPEAPLVGGIVDFFQDRRLAIFGPTRAAARLEGSKLFAKQVMKRAEVPTADFEVFNQLQPALDFIRSRPAPMVVKADGLAAGKGVLVAQTRSQAEQAVRRILEEKAFGEAGSQLIIEECLSGPELSVIGLVDGEQFILLAPSQDHKRAHEGDRGPNTGGMGAICPVPGVGPELLEQIGREVFEPVVREMKRAGAPFTGILYAGLMLTDSGPKVLEFNVRFGDPECQAILPRLQSDLVELILACNEGRVAGTPPVWKKELAACVVLASEGYPAKPDIGRAITGIPSPDSEGEALVFHAGTRIEKGRLINSGGRVLNVVGLGETLSAALTQAYGTADRIEYIGKWLRRDIGAKTLGNLEATARRKR